MHMPLGPLIIDIAGTELTAIDRARLTHPLVGGIILFTRNFASYSQIQHLIAEIRALRSPRLLITVDHEGGRVQRWHHGFTAIPAMGTLGTLYEQNPSEALQQAYAIGRTIGQELTQVGVDLNFAPVLDLDYGNSKVLRGARAFHAKPDIVAQIARPYILGLRSAGMQAIGKHFPGHGAVVADSHFDLPSDKRPFAELTADIYPFQELIQKRLLAGVMTAHILYSQMCADIATLSSFWLKTVLRQQLQFHGAIISDDLSMKALDSVGNYPRRLRLALNAGCDLILLCNNPTAVDQVLGCMDAWRNTDNIIQRLYAQ